MSLKGAILLHTGVRKCDGHQVRKIFPPQTSLVLVGKRYQPGLELPVQPCWVPRPPEGVSLHPSAYHSGDLCGPGRLMEVKLPVFTVATSI